MTEINVYHGCQEDEESIRHIFWDCAVAREVWKWTYSPVDFSFPLSITPADQIEKNGCNKVLTEDRAFWPSKFMFMLWRIWKSINDMVFNGGQPVLRNIVQLALCQAKEVNVFQITHANGVTARN